MTTRHAVLLRFAVETRERLRALTALVQQLEQHPDGIGPLAEMLRQVHSLKGTAQVLQLHDIADLAHKLEDLMVAAQQQPRLLGPAALDTVFGAFDVLMLRVEHIEHGSAVPVDVQSVCESLARLTQSGAEDAAEQPVDATEPMADAQASYAVRVPVGQLEELGSLAADLVLQTLHAGERYGRLARVESDLRALQQSLAAAPPPAVPPRAALEALARITADVRQLVDGSDDSHARLALITDHLRRNVLELTTVPVATVFEALPAMVRRLARAANGRVALIVSGGHTQVDKKVVEQLADPLIHLVRNAIDHGLEPPDVRARAGKPSIAQLTISAEQHGNRVRITIHDDGRGIDREQLRHSAVRLGLATSEEVAAWNDAQLLGLIFTPGFTTRGNVGALSGRGVGMDVVRTTVVRLGGRVRVESEPGRGTTVRLDLPISLALMRGVLVQVGGETFAVPTASVRGIAHEHGDGHAVVHVDRAPAALPVLPLGAVFGLQERDAHPAAILMSTARGRHIGIAVDAVSDEQELVVKEIRGRRRDLPFFSGATLLANGEIIPILNVNALPVHQAVTVATIARAALAHNGAAVATAAPHPPAVLVVEDSPITSQLHRHILSDAGYEVGLAVDGQQALEKLSERSWDLVIADVEMPVMNGLELATRMRSDARSRNIPLIMVTSRDSAADRQLGLAAGAQEYIPKREFDQARLLASVRRLIR